MEKQYCLSDFGLNKQSLKRKLKEITHTCWKAGLESILDKRTTKYTLSEIQHLIEGFYSGVGNLDVKSKQPLSVYYSLHNKEKYKNLKTLVEIKKSGSIDISIEKDVKNILNFSHENFTNNDDEYGELSRKLDELYYIENLVTIMSEIEEAIELQKDHVFYTFSFADEDGTFFCAMEHGHIFGNLKTYVESHH